MIISSLINPFNSTYIADNHGVSDSGDVAAGVHAAARCAGATVAFACPWAASEGTSSDCFASTNSG
jgi:Zn-dependent M28 family amino/carboxypeptidase